MAGLESSPSRPIESARGSGDRYDHAGNAVAATTELLTGVIDKLAAAAGLDRQAEESRGYRGPRYPQRANATPFQASGCATTRAVVKQVPGRAWPARQRRRASRESRRQRCLAARRQGVAALTSSISKIHGCLPPDALDPHALEPACSGDYFGAGRAAQRRGRCHWDCRRPRIAEGPGCGMPAAGLSSLLQASAFYDRLGVAAAPAAAGGPHGSRAATSGVLVLARHSRCSWSGLVRPWRQDGLEAGSQSRDLAASAAQMRTTRGIAYLAATVRRRRLHRHILRARRLQPRG